MMPPVILNLEYPVNAFALHRALPERYPYLLESTVRGASENTRFDILFAFPGETLRWGPSHRAGHEPQPDFLARLNHCWQQAAATRTCPPPLPFAGGWFVYLGYEQAAEIEHRLTLPPADGALPQAFATRIPVAIINDHHTQTAYLVAEADYDLPRAIVERDLQSCVREPTMQAKPIDAISEDNPQQYLDNIEKIKQYIYHGDVYQVNLSRQWSGTLPNHDYANTLYQQLRQTNPAPFSGLVKIDRQAILSSSPERLVKIRGRQIDTRPIAGTRARGDSVQDDQRLEDELLANLKERAEHLMLLDLERNDLGRICQPGTVQVTELMAVEHYAHVQHIVSNITGQLRAEVLPGDVLRAVFPGGTITGCPKERCMAIIAELEQTGRGAYTGSMGYLNHDGSMDMNILIRTIVVDEDRFYFRAGAGIVADSDPERELQETRIKAEGMLRAFRRQQP
ncbi:MAG: aminodeoxychorismate synthase component I [Gammaproteobacteria bacterium]